MGWDLRAATLACGVLGGTLMLAVPALAATTCTVKSIQAAAPKDTTIVSAEKLDKPVAHCKIDGYVTTTDPGPNKNNFRLQLPDKKLWKGRYYFVGLGGAAGYVPTDSQIPGGNPMVKGFAVAGTDTGHQGNIGDWSFMSDEVKALDHVHRGAHVTALATQQITKAYYGVDKIYRYHSGCSGGGRMGSEAIRHHPEDYDGVLVGSGVGTGPYPAATMLKFIQASQEQTREPGSWVSPDKLKMVDAHVTAACDDTDGAHDDVVWDSRLCHYDVAKLKCKKGDAPDCLTKPEIKTLKAILKGPHGPKGELLTQPMPISNMSTWASFNGAGPPPWSTDASPENMRKASSGYIMSTTMAHGFVRPDYDVLKDMDFSAPALEAWDKGLRKAEYSLPNRPEDYAGFEKAGGKVMFWNGTSDACCSYIEVEQLYDDTVKFMGNDANRVSKFMALYGIPGQGHCGGGTGPVDAPDQLLQSLVDWVEQGKTPAGVVTHRGADRAKRLFVDAKTQSESGVVVPNPVGVSRDFLVCPYPQVSVFDKAKASVPGAVYEAANWSCRASRQ